MFLPGLASKTPYMVHDGPSLTCELGAEDLDRDSFLVRVPEGMFSCGREPDLHLARIVKGLGFYSTHKITS